MKPLGSWSRDLSARIEVFSTWAQMAHPPRLFWIGAFSFPTGFLTAVMQTSARHNGISVDALSWEFTVATVNEVNPLAFTAKDGGVQVSLIKSFKYG
ncbi:unnamed protein product [Protopolystoma xenopodis]|uniref:Dynein heavy chain C-terminal domain-containing protein n=1 Tax=Protopolystoma xenopodis TaxID=117903 RepID=A0A3S5BBH1_9PLAT|nr:unnamed protein product [Protopolystoma xenopodis]